MDDLSGFQNVNSLSGSLRIRELASLTNLDGLQEIRGIDDRIISNCPVLESTAALGNLKTIAGVFTVEENETLVNLGSFDALAYVGENFTINNNDQLTDISGFNKLKIVEDGHLEINYNNSLQNNVGFNALVSVADGFSTSFLLWCV